MEGSEEHLPCGRGDVGGEPGPWGDASEGGEAGVQGG
jgi:hypothetical protein